MINATITILFFFVLLFFILTFGDAADIKSFSDVLHDSFGIGEGLLVWLKLKIIDNEISVPFVFVLF